MSLAGARQFDFSPTGYAVASGYTGATNAAYSATTGFGWQSSAGVYGGGNWWPNANPLTSDFVYSNNATFLVDLPNGTYTVAPTLGSLDAAQSQVAVRLNGQQVASNLATTPGQYITPAYQVNVTGGRLAVQVQNLSPTFSYFWLDGLSILPGTVPVPTASAGGAITTGVGVPVTFSQAKAGGTGPLNLSWYFGDYGSTTTPTSSGALQPTHAYTKPGTYTAMLTVVDANGLVTASPVTVIVNASASPTVNAGSNQTVNEGSKVTFAGTVTGGTGPYTYAWNFGDGISLNANTATYVGTDTVTQGNWKGVYGLAGYNVVGDASSYPSYAVVTPSGQSSSTWTSNATDMRALQKSAAGSTARIAACWYGSSFTVDVNLTDGQAHRLSLYLLDYSTTLRSERIDVMDAATGAVLDSRTIGSFSGGKYVTWNIGGHVQLKLTSLAGYNAVISGLFIEPASATSSSGSLTPSHVYADQGTYTATLTVTDAAGRSGTSSTVVTVANVAPTATLTAPSSANAGTAVSFSATATDPSTVDTAAGFTYAWNFGDGSTGTGVAPTHTYASAGNYTVSVTAKDKDGGVSAAVTKVVSIASSLVISVGTPAAGKEGSSVAFAGTVSGGKAPYTYSWNFGDGTTASGSLTPAHAYADNGTYTAVLSVKDASGQTKTSSVAVTVANVAPTATFSGPSSRSVGTPVSFTATATDPSAVDTAAGFTYTWNFGDGSTGSGAAPTHAYASAGNYTVSVTAKDKDGGVSTAATQAIVINAPGGSLVLNAGSAISTNEATALTFAASLSGGTGPYTFYWNYGDGTTATTSILNPTYTYQDNGVFNAWVYVTDSTGLTASSSVTVTVANVAPAITMMAPPTGNVGSAVTFIASPFDPSTTDWIAGFTYNWTFGDGSSSSGTNQAPTHTYSTAGNYTATVTATDKDGATSVLASTSIVIAVATVIPIDQSWLQTNGPAPYYLTQAGATYQLQSDVTVDGTGFIVLNKNITFDLNGHTITYGNSQPITVSNGGFESGTSPTDIPSWDVSLAPGAVRVPAMTGMWGNWMLQLPNVSATKSIVSAPITISSANLEYSAVITPYCSRWGSTVTLSVIDTVTGNTLASANSSDPNRGFSAVVQFVPTTTNPVKLRVDFIPPSGQTVAVNLDYAAVYRSRDYGVVATPSPWQLPQQLRTSQVQSNAGYETNFTVKNGSIIQGQGRSSGGAAVFTMSSTGTTVDTVQIQAGGMDTNLIEGMYTTDLIVRNSTLVGAIDRISNRMAAYAAIAMQRSQGTVTIVNNQISGQLQSGVMMTGASFTGLNYKSIRILGNTIQEDSSWTDGYGIIIGCALNNFEVANNSITPVNGRGILIDGAGGGNSTTQNGWIHDNIVQARERPNLEYDPSGLEATALRIRNYNTTQKNITIANNTFEAYTGAGLAWEAIGARITMQNDIGQMNGANMVFSNNTFKGIVSSIDSSYLAPKSTQAIAFSLSQIDPGSGIVVRNNRFESNCTSLNIGDNDSYGATEADVLLIGNTVVKSSEGVAMATYASIVAGDWKNSVTNVRLIDMNYANGATSTISFRGGLAKDIAMGWLLNVTVVDSSGNPLANAAVSVTDQQGNLVYAGTTNAQGWIQGIAVLTDFFSVAANEDGQQMHTIKQQFKVNATTAGKSGSNTVTITGDRSVTVTAN